MQSKSQFKRSSQIITLTALALVSFSAYAAQETETLEEWELVTNEADPADDGQKELIADGGGPEGAVQQAAPEAALMLPIRIRVWRDQDKDAIDKGPQNYHYWSYYCFRRQEDGTYRHFSCSKKNSPCIQTEPTVYRLEIPFDEKTQTYSADYVSTETGEVRGGIARFPGHACNVDVFPATYFDCLHKNLYKKQADGTYQKFEWLRDPETLVEDWVLNNTNSWHCDRMCDKNGLLMRTEFRPITKPAKKPATPEINGAPENSGNPEDGGTPEEETPEEPATPENVSVNPGFVASIFTTLWGLTFY